MMVHDGYSVRMREVLGSKIPLLPYKGVFYIPSTRDFLLGVG